MTRWWVLLVALGIASIGSTALAQPAQQFAPIDEELWNRTREAILQQSMPYAAHQAVLNIMQQIEQQARHKAAIERARTTKPSEPPDNK